MFVVTIPNIPVSSTKEDDFVFCGDNSEVAIVTIRVLVLGLILHSSSNEALTYAVGTSA
jgi:hypothetical protein